MDVEYGYGLWLLVVVNSAIFIAFGVSFFHPRSNQDWRVLGGFSAFVVALFAEMYGYPFTIYLLSGPLGGVVPGVDLSHNSGHLWTDLIGWKGDPHVSPFHLASYVFIFGGFWLIYAGWKALFAAIRAGDLATTGPYERVRHPQYLGFVLIMVGFLLQWPTLATLAMFPILLFVYRRLAIREEREVAERFGVRWERYASSTPRFLPRLRSPGAPLDARAPTLASSRHAVGLHALPPHRSVVTPIGYVERADAHGLAEAEPSGMEQALPDEDRGVPA